MMDNPVRTLILTIAVDANTQAVTPVGNLNGAGDMIMMLDAIEVIASNMRRNLHVMFEYAANEQLSPSAPTDP